MEPAIRGFIIGNHVDSVEVGRVALLPQKKLSRQTSLQRCKTEEISPVPLEDELIETVTKATQSVVENKVFRITGAAALYVLLTGWHRHLPRLLQSAYAGGALIAVLVGKVEWQRWFHLPISGMQLL